MGRQLRGVAVPRTDSVSSTQAVFFVMHISTPGIKQQQEAGTLDHVVRV